MHCWIHRLRLRGLPVRNSRSGITIFAVARSYQFQDRDASRLRQARENVYRARSERQPRRAREESRSQRPRETRETEWRSTTGEEWDGTRIVFRLKEDQGKTTVRFAHADWKAETYYFVSCNTTWGELMYRLKAAAEGKTPGPLFNMEGMAY